MTTDSKTLTFTGTETGFLDDHCRLVLSQAWREALAGYEVGMILLANDESCRLVVYPCPSGMQGVFRPEPTPAWDNLPPRGEFLHRVDPIGRVCLPPQCHQHFVGKRVMVDGCHNHIVVRLAQAPE